MIRFKHSVEDSFKDSLKVPCKGYFRNVVFLWFLCKSEKARVFSGENFRECCFVCLFLSFDGKTRRISKVPLRSRAGRPH